MSDDPNLLHCPRCGADYNRGYSICPSCEAAALERSQIEWEEAGRVQVVPPEQAALTVAEMLAERERLRGLKEAAENALARAYDTIRDRDRHVARLTVEQVRLRATVAEFVATVEDAADDPRRMFEEGKIRALQERGNKTRDAYVRLKAALDAGDVMDGSDG